MKNIHLIPTDKPSRLYFEDVKFKLTEYDYPNVDYAQNQHIYITNDEEIKEEDWVFGMDGIFQYKGKVNLPDVELPKKIILTTDAQLIADGVQQISDEFLEWFIKNPTCEFVEWSSEKIEGSFDGENWKYKYGTVIPQEKSITYEEFRIKASTDLLDKFDKDCLKYSEDGDSDNHFYADCKYWEGKLKEESKQETLEGAAEDFANSKKWMNGGASEWVQHIFKEGAKWQQQNSYSEKEVNEIIAETWNSCEDNEGETFTEVRKRILEQFKKK
jgi:hypothetical protein